MPLWSGGEDGGALVSFSHQAAGQRASLADPSSAFQPLDSLGMIANQTVDFVTLPTVPPQHVDLFAQVAANLHMPLDALTQHQTIGAHQNPAIGDI